VCVVSVYERLYVYALQEDVSELECRRVIECLLLLCHFAQKSPIICV